MQHVTVLILNIIYTWYFFKGRDSSVGIATRYGLDGPGIESRWGGPDFPHPSRPALVPTQPPVQWVPGLSRGWSGRGVMLTTYPTLASRSWKGRAVPLLTLWAFVACYGENFTFFFLPFTRYFYVFLYTYILTRLWHQFLQNYKF